VPQRGDRLEKHPHIPARHLIDRIVLGGSDGAIEGLAMTAALNGAGVGFGTVVLAGAAFAVAGSVSMFISSYLSHKSEQDSLRADIQRERMEIETEPDEERGEMEELLKREGYSQEDVDVIMRRLMGNKEMWLKEQLSRELRLHTEDLVSDRFSGPTSAGLAFLALALLAVAPYAATGDRIPALAASVVVSLAAIFALTSRAFIPKYFNMKAGAQAALVAGAAAGLLYLLGSGLSHI
jgi:vacuolar iron transporter family protein